MTGTAKAEARRRLQDAAFDLFAQHGSANVTIDQITQRARVSRRTFFRYFSAKEDAALGDHNLRIEHLRHLLAEPPRPGDDALDHVVACGRSVLATIWDDPEFYRKRYRAVFADLALLDRMTVTDRHFCQLISDAVSGAFTHPDHGPLHARMFAAAAMALANNTIERWVLDPALDPDAHYLLGSDEIRRAAAAWIDRTDRVTNIAVIATDLSLQEIRRRLDTGRDERPRRIPPRG